MKFHGNMNDNSSSTTCSIQGIIMFSLPFKERACQFKMFKNVFESTRKPRFCLIIHHCAMDRGLTTFGPAELVIAVWNRVWLLLQPVKMRVYKPRWMAEESV